jgi:hypothetical protein
MNTIFSHTSTFRSIYLLVSIVVLSIAVLLGSSAPEYENKHQEQYNAYTTTETLPGFNFAAAGE